jgi:hypothetical protein
LGGGGGGGSYSIRIISYKGKAKRVIRYRN